MWLEFGRSYLSDYDRGTSTWKHKQDMTRPKQSNDKSNNSSLSSSNNISNSSSSSEIMASMTNVASNSNAVNKVYFDLYFNNLAL